MKKRVCDFIADFIYSYGINDVFMFPGGGNKFLIDGLAQKKELNKISCHHEQGVSMAAVAYAKYNGIGVGVVTTGCGGTNTITGILNAYNDSTACVIITGQCHSKQIISAVDVPLRQMGIQEADIVSIVKPITKYAVLVKKAQEIRYEMEKAFYIATEGRPGPVVLDIPLDISNTIIDDVTLRAFDKENYVSQFLPTAVNDDYECLYELLKKSERPVIVGGGGIRMAKATNLFKDFVERFDVPAVFARMGFDTLPYGTEYNMGVIGNHGNRMGNFTLQNADLVVSIGSRLGINAVGYSYELFARAAKVIVVDIDENEHKKNTVRIDKFIHADAKALMDYLLKKDKLVHRKWMDWCKTVKQKYPTCPKEKYNDINGVSQYAFLNELSSTLPEKAVICADAGSAFFVTPQALKLKEGHRYITSGGQAEMGFTIPACVGSAIASRLLTIGITGDGSFMLNMQELATIVHHDLPVKLFVWNNNGYMGIRQMQDTVFQGRHMGVDSNSGLGFPNFSKVSDGFGIRYRRINSISELRYVLEDCMKTMSPELIEVMCDPNEPILSAGTKKMSNGENKQILEDMIPQLSREEFNKVMIVKPV